MLVHIWAAEKGIIHVNNADGHEAELGDQTFGFDYDDLGGNQRDDCFINAFGDLLEDTHTQEGQPAVSLMITMWIYGKN